MLNFKFKWMKKIVFDRVLEELYIYLNDEYWLGWFEKEYHKDDKLWMYSCAKKIIQNQDLIVVV